MAFMISADDIKKSLPGYNPSHSEILHAKSARLADKEYEKAVKLRPEGAVILMSGGAASGKTEYISAYLNRRKAIIFDGTLPTYKGAQIKIKRALKHNKRIEIHAVLPDNLPTAFIAFLNRDRKFPPEHFFRTHSNSRKTLLEVARELPEIPISVFFSKYTFAANKMDTSFAELWIPDRGVLIDFLESNQYTEEDIKRIQGLHDI